MPVDVPSVVSDELKLISVNHHVVEVLLDCVDVFVLTMKTLYLYESFCYSAIK